MVVDKSVAFKISGVARNTSDVVHEVLRESEIDERGEAEELQGDELDLEGLLLLDIVREPAIE